MNGHFPEKHITFVINTQHAIPATSLLSSRRSWFACFDNTTPYPSESSFSFFGTLGGYRENLFLS
jgi:hypothetical protein